MENEIIRHERKFFIVEKDSENIEQVLQRYYGGSGFQRTSQVQNAYRFNDEESVKKAVSLQKQMNEFLNEEAETYYMEEVIERKAFNGDGTEYIVKE
ncbi:hypothetical protein [Staphylococcus massiliensis]|uniref:Phage protein n=1 Tax=Staphylococcus massiliensis S46 TaxID=1229783 RepID=K9B967_9STAP|nr:hypothetical protein [Staphylococcus massiliensis]EKU50310.1 hypothetical protein C273_01670 [Staphylococcus massiliensis S46]